MSHFTQVARCRVIFLSQCFESSLKAWVPLPWNSLCGHQPLAVQACVVFRCASPRALWLCVCVCVLNLKGGGHEHGCGLAKLSLVYELVWFSGEQGLEDWAEPSAALTLNTVISYFTLSLPFYPASVTSSFCFVCFLAEALSALSYIHQLLNSCWWELQYIQYPAWTTIIALRIVCASYVQTNSCCLISHLHSTVNIHPCKSDSFACRVSQHPWCYTTL